MAAEIVSACIGIYDSVTDFLLYYDIKYGVIHCPLDRQNAATSIEIAQLIFSILGIMAVISRIFNFIWYKKSMKTIEQDQSQDENQKSIQLSQINQEQQDDEKTDQKNNDHEQSASEQIEFKYEDNKLLVDLFRIHFEDIPQIILNYHIFRFAGFSSSIQQISWYASLVSFVLGFARLNGDRLIKWIRNCMSDCCVGSIVYLICMLFLYGYTIYCLLIAAVNIETNYLGVDLTINTFVATPVNLSTLYFEDNSEQNIIGHIYTDFDDNDHAFLSDYKCDMLLDHSISDFDIIYQAETTTIVRLNTVAESSDHTSTQIIDGSTPHRITDAFQAYIDADITGVWLKSSNFVPFWIKKRNAFEYKRFALKFTLNGRFNEEFINQLKEITINSADYANENATGFSACFNQFAVCDDNRQCVSAYMVGNFVINDDC